MDPSLYKPLGAGIAMIGAVGAGIGLGNIFAAWLSGLARNPSAEAKMSKIGFIGFACTELVLLMSFAIAALLIFT